MMLKKAFSGLSAKIWLLALMMFINRSGTMVVAFMIIYTTQKLHFTIEQAGVVMMSFGIGAIMGSYLGGKLTDILGYFYVQFTSLFIGGILFFMVAQIQSFHLLCGAVAVLAIFGEAYRPANAVSIAHFSTPENLTRSISLVRIATNMGWALGPVIGGYFATKSYTYLFWADGFTNILAACMVVLFLKSPKKIKEKLSVDQAKSNKLESPWRDKVFMLFILFSIFYILSFSPLFTVLPAYYKEICGMSEFQIGILMGINGLMVAVFEMLLIYKLQGKYSTLNFIAFGCFLLVINYLIYLNFTTYALMLLGIIFGTFSEIFALPYMNTFSIGRAKSHNQGQYSAIHGMTWPIAQIIGPLVGTQIIANQGYTVLLFALGGAAVIAMVGFYFLGKMINLKK
jgi:predicted MFS family arabinose efflux permease